jgi:hypothetical protein
LPADSPVIVSTAARHNASTLIFLFIIFLFSQKT